MKKILFLLLLFGCSAVNATICTWVSTVDTTWESAAGWNPSVPTATTDTARFDASSTRTCSLTVNRVVGRVVFISFTGKLHLNSSRSLTLRPASDGQYIVGGETLDSNIIFGPGILVPTTISAGRLCTLSVRTTLTGTINTVGAAVAGLVSFFKKVVCKGTFSINPVSTSGTSKYAFLNDTVSGVTFAPGVGNAGYTDTINYGSGVFNFQTMNFSTSQTGTCLHNYESAKFLCGGDIIRSSGASVTHAIGTSSWILDSSTASTITSNNKTFHTFKVAKTSSAAVTLADSLTVIGDFVDTTGKFKTAGFNMNLSGDFYRYSADSMLASTSLITLNKANALWKRLAPGAPFGGMAAATISAKNGVRFDLDTNMTIFRLISAAGKKLQFTAGRIFKDSTYTSGDLDNDSLISLTAGSKAYLNLPANTPLTGTFIKDIYAVNLIYDTSAAGLNGGNDSNIIFKYATAVYARSPTTVTVTSASPASVVIAGGTLDTLTGTGFYPPCSVLVAGGSYISATYIDTTKISFTTPISTAGLKSVTVKNGDFKTGVGNVLTYTSATTTPVIDSVRPYWQAISMAAQKRGATFRIRGAGFKATQSTGTLYLGSSDLLTAATWTDTLVVDTIPATWTPKGTYNIIVKNSDDLRDTSQIRVLIPTITPMTP